jgi:hypothetical protein
LLNGTWSKPSTTGPKPSRYLGGGGVSRWFTEEAVAAWHAPATGARGAQPIDSAIAIETSLVLDLVFDQPLRQTEGLLRSVANVLGIAIAIPEWAAKASAAPVHVTIAKKHGLVNHSRVACLERRASPMLSLSFQYPLSERSVIRLRWL